MSDKLTIAREKAAAAKREAEARKILKKNPPPVMIEHPEQ